MDVLTNTSLDVSYQAVVLGLFQDLSCYWFVYFFTFKTDSLTSLRLALNS